MTDSSVVEKAGGPTESSDHSEMIEPSKILPNS